MKCLTDINTLHCQSHQEQTGGVTYLTKHEGGVGKAGVTVTCHRDRGLNSGLSAQSHVTAAWLHHLPFPPRQSHL